MVDIVRLVDIDTDALKQEDDSVLKIYTWFCHRCPDDMGSLMMYATEYEAALKAADHIGSNHN